jgi:hypothetical protein
MFAKERRAPTDMPGAFRKFIRIPRKTVPAQMRVINLHDIIAMPGLFIIEKGAGRINWGGGQPPPLKLIEETFHVIIQSAGLDEAIEQRP